MSKKYVHYSNDLRSMINQNNQGESTQTFYDLVTTTHIERLNSNQQNNYNIQEPVVNNLETNEPHNEIQQHDNMGKNVLEIKTIEPNIPSQENVNNSVPSNITSETVIVATNIKVISKVNLTDDKISKQSKDSKEKPHACDRCDFRTLYYGVLKKHKLMHQKNTCVICKLELANQKKFAKHLRTVHKVKSEKMKTEKAEEKVKVEKKNTGEGDYECDTCVFKTTKVHSLAQHKKMVHKDFPYKCLFCDFTSTVPKTVRAHIVKQHTVSTTKDNVMKRYARSYKCKRETKS